MSEGCPSSNLVHSVRSCPRTCPNLCPHRSNSGLNEDQDESCLYRVYSWLFDFNTFISFKTSFYDIRENVKNWSEFDENWFFPGKKFKVRVSIIRAISPSCVRVAGLLDRAFAAL